MLNFPALLQLCLQETCQKFWKFHKAFSGPKKSRWDHRVIAPDAQIGPFSEVSGRLRPLHRSPAKFPEPRFWTLNEDMEQGGQGRLLAAAPHKHVPSSAKMAFSVLYWPHGVPLLH